MKRRLAPIAICSIFVLCRAAAVSATPIHHTIERNGYKFAIDSAGRTRSASGQLRIDDAVLRSRRAQARTGGSDRKPTDDGGHYIAARFGGPTDKFNHFAQDRNFNRGAYRSMEEGWAKSIKEGHKVKVDISPHYSGGSQRPDQLTVRWTIDGHPKKSFLANQPGGK
ncbi:MAG: DNA/RNA non-specific endonuclease [Novosphingobium sp.]